MKGEWVKETPSEPGHYWVLIHGVSPELICLTRQGVVLRFGTNELISTYYDVKQWWSEPVALPA